MATPEARPFFEDLPEETIAPAGLNPPKPSSEHLTDYAKTLGDGTRSLIGIPTGFEKLDRLTLGLDGLTILAGIPGKGKTSLALQVAFNACESGAPVLFYSLEMPRRAIFTKILSRLARVSYTDLLLKGRPYLDSGYSVSEDRAQYLSVKPEELTAAMARLQSIAGRFYVIDKTDGPLDTERLEAQIAWAQAEHDGKRALVVIDHLQIFPTGAQAFSGIKDKIDYLVAAFEGVKDRTGAAVLVISQKNRAGYYGKGLETLMGSAQIEYTADAVLLLDSKQEQEARERRKSGTEMMSELDEMMKYVGPVEAIELIIAKQRYNTPGRLPLVFDGRCSEFREGSK